jgi:hypothetical protein
MEDTFSPEQNQFNQNLNSQLPNIDSPNSEIYQNPNTETKNQSSIFSNITESVTTGGKFDFNKLKPFFQKYLVDKCPVVLPENFSEVLVKFSPLIALIGAISSLSLFLALFGITAFFSPFSTGSSQGIYRIINGLESFVYLIFEIILIPGLTKRTIKAWNTIYVLVFVNSLFNIINLDFGQAIIGTALYLYILFQCRSKFTY